MTAPSQTVTYTGRSDGKHRPGVVVEGVRLALDVETPASQAVVKRCRELQKEGLYSFDFSKNTEGLTAPADTGNND